MASMLPALANAQQTDTPGDAPLESVQVIGTWLGTGLQNSIKTFPGARSLVAKDDIEASGAGAIDEVMRRIPGVQATENAGSAGSQISLNLGVRGLTGRYTPRSTVLLDGVPLAVAPYGQPQLSFAPISLGNIDSIDVVRSGGAVRYGPQNVGGIINFATRSVPNAPGFTGDLDTRQAEYAHGGESNTQYSAYLGVRLPTQLGLALLYSGMTGRDWRAGSSDRFDDVALKGRYDITLDSQLSAKVAYFGAKAYTPGGLTVAQYGADPYQNTRPTDHWTGERKSVDLAYVNAISASRDFELRTYYVHSIRTSALIDATGTQLGYQPRDYSVVGIEPHYTQRWVLGPTTQDVTVGYRFVAERGVDTAYNQTLASGSVGTATTFDNTTSAHAVYVDDRILIDAWRITPGVRFENIASVRRATSPSAAFDTRNRVALPSVSVAYLAMPALTLFTNYTTSFGPVQFAELNAQSAANPLRPELARSGEIGARWTDARLHAEITAFQIRFDNQIQSVAGVTPPLFQNIGATKHDGFEMAVDYNFQDGPLAGLNLFANYSFTRAVQESGTTAGRDLPFYSRNTDTLGMRYAIGAWSWNVDSTAQSAQFSDNANTVAETADASVGRVPGFRLWNAQANWKWPGAKTIDVRFGVNNLSDRRYYTRNVDPDHGRMVGPPRTTYVQGRASF
jgi:Fe(3+) dicitrate transport protein